MGGEGKSKRGEGGGGLGIKLSRLVRLIVTPTVCAFLVPVKCFVVCFFLYNAVEVGWPHVGGGWESGEGFGMFLPFFNGMGAEVAHCDLFSGCFFLSWW